MALTIATNVASLNAQRNLNASQGALGKALQRLSSGLRINSAGDDAAGLAISERFTTQIRGINQSVRNANDGISMLQTADGALGTVTQNLQRIRELAVQAANASNSEADRAALQQEVAQLTQEIDRVGRTTTFNGQQLFGQSEISVLGDSDQLAVMDGLRSGWLTEAENLIREYYGIQAHGNSIKIELTSFTDVPAARWRWSPRRSGARALDRTSRCESTWRISPRPICRTAATPRSTTIGCSRTRWHMR